jgi:TatA/E family protein of Tat protein translocase
MVLLFLESLGTTELLVILVVALVLFGPRKLPEITRSFGKSLSEFKRASDDFKRTWEREVALESVQREAAIERAMVAEPEPARISPDERGEEAAIRREILRLPLPPRCRARASRAARTSNLLRLSPLPAMQTRKPRRNNFHARPTGYKSIQRVSPKS